MAQSEPSRKSLYFDYPEYPFVRPAELDGESWQHPVVIVGAGPIGMTAALELARHGIRTVVMDDKNTVNEGSRAICKCCFYHARQLCPSFANGHQSVRYQS